MNIRVDRARRIGQADAVLERQARSRPHLHLIALGDRHGKAGGDGVTTARLQHQRLGRHHVHACGMGSGIGGHGQPLSMRQALELDFNQGKRRGHGRPFR